MSERLTNEEAVERALSAAPRGADMEVFLRDATSTSVEVKDGAIENVLSHGERGVGVRVVRDQRLGFAFTSDLSPAGIAECAGAAEAMSRITEADPHLRIAAGPTNGSDLGIDEGVGGRTVEERAEAALATERSARALDPRVSGFRKTSFTDGEMTTVIATTAGARGSYRESWCGLSTSVIAADGDDRQIGYHGHGSRRRAEVDPEAIGRRAASVAVGKLGARSMPTQGIAVVLEPYEAMSLLAAIGPLFSAENVLKGKSLFAGRVGEAVASAKVTIVDDARRPGGLRSAPFDGEGTTTSRRTLIAGGRLEGYLTSLKTAAKLGCGPTGNARRSSYSGPGRVGPSNFYIEAGADDATATVGGLERALRITALLNLHTIDPISGEFSLGAAGDYLERGERLYPVQGITIAGNLLGLLSSISVVGTDLTFGGGGIGSPTLVISELSVGGT